MGIRIGVHKLLAKDQLTTSKGVENVVIMTTCRYSPDPGAVAKSHDREETARSRMGQQVSHIVHAAYKSE